MRPGERAEVRLRGRGAWLPCILAAVCASGAGGTVWAQGSEASNRPEGIRYDPRGRRDPFSPLVRDGQFVGVAEGIDVGAPPPLLFGILWDPDGKSIALIDDEEVRIGETVSGYRVEQIKQDHVVLRKDEKELVLQLPFEEASRTGPGGAKPGRVQP
ncbi:MAG TPA: hypothetical protein VGB20_05185 [bacterium]